MTTAGLDLRRLQAALAALDPALGAPAMLDALVAAGHVELPLPGHGHTLARWQALAAVAAHDLSLAKLYEGHTDALAILAELGGVSLAVPGSRWGVWAAEAPEGRAVVGARTDDTASGLALELNGAKCWCSGAASASHALLTAWRADGRGPFLVAIELAQPGLQVHAGAWQAVGMAGSASLDVRFERVSAQPVGDAGAYLARPGFWHGGAGVAACWYGGAVALAESLRTPLLRAAPAARTAFRLAALGRVDLALRTTAALLREAAECIDADPLADAHALALRVRLAAEACATTVLDEVGRALGAAPFCRDARFARRAADLPVFIRQSHAERDLQALGDALTEPADAAPWAL